MRGELFEGYELGFVGWGESGRREGKFDCAVEGDALDFARVRVRAGEDGLENGGEVERVEG